MNNDYLCEHVTSFLQNTLLGTSSLQEDNNLLFKYIHIKNKQINKHNKLMNHFIYISAKS